MCGGIFPDHALYGWWCLNFLEDLNHHEWKGLSDISDCCKTSNPAVPIPPSPSLLAHCSANLPCSLSLPLVCVNPLMHLQLPMNEKWHSHFHQNDNSQNWTPQTVKHP